MKVRFFWAFSFLLFASLITLGCKEQSNESKSKWRKPKTIVEGLTVANASLSSIAVVKNDIAVLYVNNNKLRFRSGVHKVTLDEGGNYSPQNLWLISKGRYVYAFWWQKFVYGRDGAKKNQVIKGKSLFVRASSDYGKTFYKKVRINSGNGVLPDLDIVANESGNVSVIYDDERQPDYQVYVNSSSDGGKTWLKTDIRLDKVLGQEAKIAASHAGTPHIAYVGNVLIALWQQYDTNNGKPLTRVVSRESVDGGITWGAEKIVFQDHGDVASTLDIIVTDTQVYALWLDRNKKGLVLFSRKVDGDWIASGEIAPGTKDAFAISWLKGVADDKNLYILFTYEKKPLKDRVVFIKFDRKSFKWYPNVFQLDQHPPSLKYVAKAWNSDIAMLPNGIVLTVWEDYDAIVPGVHLNYLNPKNGKWLKEKIRVTKPGLVDARSPKIYLGKDGLWLLFYYTELKETGHPPTTQIASLYYKYTKAGIDISSIKRNLPDIKKSKEIITKKVNALWKSRLENNKEKEWLLHDPVFRIKFQKKKWVKSDSGIKYASFTVDRINIQGVYAKVEGKVTYKIPEEMMRAKMLDPEDEKKVDPKVPVDSTYALKFGWFYDDWYFIPEMMFMQHIDD